MAIYINTNSSKSIHRRVLWLFLIQNSQYFLIIFFFFLDQVRLLSLLFYFTYCALGEFVVISTNDAAKWLIKCRKDTRIKSDNNMLLIYLVYIYFGIRSNWMKLNRCSGNLTVYKFEISATLLSSFIISACVCNPNYRIINYNLENKVYTISRPHSSHLAACTYFIHYSIIWSFTRVNIRWKWCFYRTPTGYLSPELL